MHIFQWPFGWIKQAIVDLQTSGLQYRFDERHLHYRTASQPLQYRMRKD